MMGIWHSKMNMEVPLCRMPLHRHYGCGRVIDGGWRPLSASVPPHSGTYSGPASFCYVPMVFRTARSNVSSIPVWTPLSAGVAATSKKAWTGSKTALVQADRRFFPPAEQHKIVALATRPPIENGVPVTHWSATDLAHATVQDGIVASISRATVWRLLDQAAIKPHRWHYWLHSPDPDFDAKMLDIVDLYLHAQELCKRREIVLSVDEKTSIQALERKHPNKPPKPGRVEGIEHEYIRHGTCCLTASLEVATGEIYAHLTPNRPADVFADFVASVCGEYPRAKKIHFVLDNLNTHWHELTCRTVAKLSRCPLPPIQTGTQRKVFLTSPGKRIVFHFTPSHASWLNQIEIWFGTLVRRLLRRGNFASVADLENKIIKFVQYYDEYLAHPYRWTYTGKPLAANVHAA
jgi:transposase